MYTIIINGADRNNKPIRKKVEVKRLIDNDIREIGHNKLNMYFVRSYRYNGHTYKIW